MVKSVSYIIINYNFLFKWFNNFLCGGYNNEHVVAGDLDSKNHLCGDSFSIKYADFYLT
ncbi:hypothetical protein D3C75_946290 [compost metagenome]